MYDHTLQVMRDAVARARIGNEDRLGALRRLDDQCRLAEAAAAGRELPSLPALLSEERALAPSRGGRTVFDDRSDPPKSTRAPRRRGQLSLF